MATQGEERARRLEELVARLRQQVEGLSREALYAEPGEGAWSVMKVLAHVSEILSYWSRQAQVVAARDQNSQPFGRTPEDPDRIAAVEAHAHDALDGMLARLGEALAGATAILSAIPAGGWARTARHARRGEMTVEQIVDQFLVEHVQEHTQQVESVQVALTAR